MQRIVQNAVERALLDAQRAADVGGLLCVKMLHQLQPLLHRAVRERRHGDEHRHTAQERLEQIGQRLCCRADEHKARGARRIVADAAEHARVEQGEKHLLPGRRQAVDLVEEQNAAVRLLHKTRLILERARERALFIAEQVGQQQLRIVRIFRAVELHEGNRCMRAAKRLRLLCVFPDRSGKMALAAAGRAGDEHIQAVRGIGNGRHGDPQLIFQAAVRADKAGERPVLSGLLLCLRRLLLHGRLRPDVRRLLRCWEETHVFLADPPQLSLCDELIELDCGIVAPDAQGIRNGLRRHALKIRCLCRFQDKL